jgi:DNA uptake protein ComE-like DNA-binding protein
MIKQFNRWTRNYFGFSQTETRGFVVLLLLMSVLLFFPPLYSWLSFQSWQAKPEDIKQLDSLSALIIKNMESDTSENFKEFATQYKNTPKAYTLFPFNPNEIELEDWEKLGVKTYLAERIIKYRNKGGKFRKKEDLQKIYGFPLTLYQKLAPYIRLENVANESNDKPTEKPYKPKYEDKPFVFDLNVADTALLNQVKGIGPVLAQRIVSYRDKLGGFVNLEQLYEVYNLPPEVVDEIKKYARLTTPPRLISINTIAGEDLKKHPYFRNQAWTIVNYRKQHGNFKKIEDLQKIKAIKPEDWQKMVLYLTLEP